jgi:hypothetical protein
MRRSPEPPQLAGMTDPGSNSGPATLSDAHQPKRGNDGA